MTVLHVCSFLMYCVMHFLFWERRGLHSGNTLTMDSLWIVWFWMPSCARQVLPVMIMGAFIPGLRRKYPLHEYISAVLLVVGLILFTLADAQTSPNFSVIGVVMVSSALVMDSFVGNLQEAIFTMNPETTQVTQVLCPPCSTKDLLGSHLLWELHFLSFLTWNICKTWLTVSQMEMLFCSTVVGLPLLIPPMLLTGELFTAWNSCKEVTKLILLVLLPLFSLRKLQM